MNGTDRVPAGAATRLTVLVGEADQWHHRPLYAEIVHRAHEAGLAGASVFRGVEGFGASSRVHTARLLSLSEDLPVAVVIVDEDARVRAFLPRLEGLLGDGGLVTLERCEVVRYGDGTSGTGAGTGAGGPASGTGGGGVAG
ncbi:DUF190 domain-containing protein [Streptomyces sp. enrichment culture]|uniref:DUF190 domain-containing protein n=1 Tax=Streptomyces sp. enrichment culture TaxID=1795815 RepID=UPI003F55F279